MPCALLDRSSHACLFARVVTSHSRAVAAHGRRVHQAMEAPDTIPYIIGLLVLVGGIIVPLGYVVAKNLNQFRKRDAGLGRRGRPA